MSFDNKRLVSLDDEGALVDFDFSEHPPFPHVGALLVLGAADTVGLPEGDGLGSEVGDGVGSGARGQNNGSGEPSLVCLKNERTMVRLNKIRFLK